MSQPSPTFDVLRSVMLRSEDWPAALQDQDAHDCGSVLVACAKVVLPLWEERFPADEKMRHVVDALEAWAAAPSSQALERVQAAKRLVAHTIWWCESVKGPRNQSDSPGEFAGDCIVWAAKAVTEIGDPEFRASLQRSLNNAIEALARRKAGSRMPDEDTDYWSLARSALRTEVLAALSKCAKSPLTSR